MDTRIAGIVADLGPIRRVARADRAIESEAAHPDRTRAEHVAGSSNSHAAPFVLTRRRDANHPQFFKQRARTAARQRRVSGVRNARRLGSMGTWMCRRQTTHW